jgi:O-antigen ligase
MRFVTIKQGYEYLVLLFILSISFSKALPNLILGILLLLFVFLHVKNKSVHIPKSYFLPFGLLFMYLLIKQISTGTIYQEFNFYSRLALVLGIPILLISVSRFKIMFGMVLLSVISIFIASFKTVNYYLIHKVIPFSNVAEVNDLLPLERPYMGFLWVISIFICLYLIQNAPKYKYHLLIFSFILAAFIFLIAARLSIITLIILLAIYIFIYSNLNVVKKVTLFVSPLLLVGLLLFNYSNLSKRFFVSAKIETIIDYEPRVEIWSCSYKIFQEKSFNYLFGFKTNKILENKLIECYSTEIKNESKKQYFLDLKFNTHNQFMDFFFIGGLIGLSLFLYYCTLLLMYSRKNFFMFAIGSSLIVFFFLENVLHRQYGCYLVALIFTLIIKNRNNES